MSDQYRLVYSAELNEGQHAAVVKKRLAAILKLDDARMDVLFSGKSVVVKKATDEKTAIRYQEVFNKAGARLRILPVEGAGSAVSDAAPAKQEAAKQEAAEGAPEAPQASPAPSSAPAPAEDGSLGVLAVGAELLTDSERAKEVEADVDTSHLSVQGAVFQVDEPASVQPGPNVDHLSLADIGTQIGESPEEIVAEIDADFDLAEVGVILGRLEEPDVPAPPVADFDLADTGADIDTTEKKPPPPPPDTSHLTFDDD
jgi:hypothetical protein